MAIDLPYSLTVTSLDQQIEAWLLSPILNFLFLMILVKALLELPAFYAGLLLVPSDLCRWAMDSLVKNGRVERGHLGVMIQNLTPDLAKAFKLDRTTGALVGDVSPGSPADRAAL
jgi:hypothetical protein